jgi:hypothetical protein
LEESLSLIEKMISSIPKTPGVEPSQVFKEAEDLYREIKKELTEKGTAHSTKPVPAPAAGR